MENKHINSKQIVFAALESYSMIGGLQQFNRRIVSALSNLHFTKEYAKPKIILKGDTHEHVRNRNELVDFFACGNSKIEFLKECIKQSKKADILLLGHINLLSIGLLSKFFNPKLKIILFVHGEDVWNTEHSRKMKFYEPFLIRYLDYIASVSRFTANRMAKEFNISAEKFIIFPNAVDQISENSKIQKNKPILITVARLAQHDWGKHHDSVIRAIPYILKSIPNIQYNIIGDGVLKPKLQELAQSLNVEHVVNFLGRVSDEVLAQSYAEASLFVMPSEKEGFGIVFLEAWLRNIPVICGTDDASHEVVTNGVDGFTIHHDNIEELAEKIKLILQNPDKANAMGQAGREKVLTNYLMNNFTENLKLLLVKVCHE